MNRISQIFILIFLIPTYVEAMDYALPTISFGPFTLGRYGLVIAGLIAFFSNKKLNKKYSKIYIGFLLVLIGNLFASIFFDTFQSVTRTIANILLFVCARGVAYFIDTPLGRKSVMYFFLGSFIYWARYFSSHVLTGGTLAVYSDLFRTGEAVNHHIIGMIISISGVFISTYFFFREGTMKTWGYIGITAAATICFISESRSNTLITLSSFVMLLLVQNRLKLLSVLRLSPVILLLLYLGNYLISSNETLSQRYDLNDVEYQERTTGIRVDMIIQAFVEFAKHPIGKGLKNVEVTIDGRTQLIHNQYLSYMVGGGIVSLIGVILWLNGVFGTFRRYINPDLKVLKDNSFNTAAMLSVLILHITLLTLEFTSLLFFILLSLGVLIEDSVNNAIVQIPKRKRRIQQ